MPGKRFTVLVVEDEEFSRSLLSGFLQELTEVTEIFQAPDANYAFRCIIMERPDLIFLDVELPGKSGIELLDDLRKIGIRPNIIFTTGYYKYANQAEQYTPFDFILKPYDQVEITATVRRFLHEYRESKPQK